MKRHVALITFDCGCSLLLKLQRDVWLLLVRLVQKGEQSPVNPASQHRPQVEEVTYIVLSEKQDIMLSPVSWPLCGHSKLLVLLALDKEAVPECFEASRFSSAEVQHLNLTGYKQFGLLKVHEL